MNLCRCEKGHFYDKEKYAVCPHCAGGHDVDTKRTESFVEDAPTGGVSQMMPPPGQGFAAGGPLTGRMEDRAPNVPPMMGGAPPMGSNVPPMGSNVPPMGSNVPPMGSNVPPMMGGAPPMGPNVPPMGSNVPPMMGGAPPIAPNVPPVISDMSADQVTVPVDELTEEMVSQADFGRTDDSDDHTIGFFDDMFSQVGEPPVDSIPSAPKTHPRPAQKPVSKPAAHMRTPNVVSTPCVGWLVALGGAHIGASFTLKVGKNFIGRGTDMDVALTEEKSVSRERHAVVIYEPRESIFLVQPGESSSLTYRNNKVVLMPIQLEAYDTITVGDVSLLFMPLCGKRFQWGEVLGALKKKNNE